MTEPKPAAAFAKAPDAFARMTPGQVGETFAYTLGVQAVLWGTQWTKAGESFRAAHIVGYFDSIEAMHQVNDRYKGHTGLTADASGWRLVK